MGLDMYLYASKYEANHTYNIEDEEELKKVVEEFYPKELQDIGLKHAKHNFLSKDVKYQIGYWRKFNALQHWFEEHYTQDEILSGVWLSEKTIKELIDIFTQVKEDLETCEKSQKVIETGWHRENGELIKDTATIEVFNSDIAEELLPPGEGFFYGSQEIDEWYKRDIEYSLELFKECLEIQQKGFDIYYDASW